MELDQEVSKKYAACLFHHHNWRNEFQFIINQLSNKVIPLKYAHKVGKILCTCNVDNSLTLDENIAVVFRVGEDNEVIFKRNNIERFYEVLFENSDHILIRIERILKSFLHDIDVSTYIFRWRLLIAIQRCLKDDFKFFKDDKPQIRLWRKKYTHCSEVNLSMPKEFFNFIVGKSGCHCKRICRKFDCAISFDVSKTAKFLCMRQRQKRNLFSGVNGKQLCKPPTVDESSDVELQTVKVKIFHNDLKVLREIVETLSAHIICVTNKAVNAHKEIVIKRQDRRLRNMQQIRERRSRHKEAMNLVWTTTMERKETASAHYERKKLKSVKEKSMKENKPSAVEEGHCRNCLIQYSKDLLSLCDCKHHPGFIVKEIQNDDNSLSPIEVNVWNCCNRELANPNSHQSRLKSHRKDGCETGQHIFKPKRKNQNGAKKSAYSHKSDSELSS